MTISPWASQQIHDLVDELQRLNRRKANTFAGAILEASAFNILWRLWEGPRTLRELSVELELEQSTVNRQVNAAIKAWLHRAIRRRGQRQQDAAAHRCGSGGVRA